MSSFISVWLIPRPAMESICLRFGGLTPAAWAALTPGMGPREFVKMSIRPDLDSRYGYAAMDSLSRAFQSINVYDDAHAVLRLLSFYWPLFASYGFHFDDSGGKERAIGPVLAPERCRHLLDNWRSVDIRAMEEQLNQYPLFFDSIHRPHKKFADARGLLDYLGCYAEFLEEAIARDSFYFSFDGNRV